jgi:hypothetical protein
MFTNIILVLFYSGLAGLIIPEMVDWAKDRMKQVDDILTWEGPLMR